MDLGRLLKWAVIAAVLIFGWKTFGPRIKERFDKPSQAESIQSSAAGGCVDRAAAASEQWGSGLARFVNPPHDLDAWGRFRGDADAKIAVAQAQCGCAEEACTRARNALTELRGIVSDLDTAIRSGSGPPSDVVQRQEAVDRAIESARELVKR